MLVVFEYDGNASKISEAVFAECGFFLAVFVADKVVALEDDSEKDVMRVSDESHLQLLRTADDVEVVHILEVLSDVLEDLT